jgi:Flp pilus assembly protein TadD
MSELKSAVEMDPSLVASRLMLGSSYLYLGKPKDAARELEAAGPLAPNAPLVLGALGVAYATSGNRAAATRIVGTLESQGAKPGAAGALAKVLIALGDTARGLSQLEVALRARDPIFSSEPFASPIFNSVRTSPRFAAVISAAGLDVGRLTSSSRP